MAERGLSLDHSTIARWVLRYAPILSQRIRCEMRRPNRSWRVGETYVRVLGRWTYLYRAVDSEGNTIDFMLSPNRDLTAAKYFLHLALWRTREVRPRVINVDGHAAYARAIAELKSSGELGRRCRCRPSPYLNNIVEQDHRLSRSASRRVYGSVRRRAHYGRLLATKRCTRYERDKSDGFPRGGCCWSGPIHPADPRHCRLNTGLVGLTRRPSTLFATDPRKEPDPGSESYAASLAHGTGLCRRRHTRLCPPRHNHFICGARHCDRRGLHRMQTPPPAPGVSLVPRAPGRLHSRATRRAPHCGQLLHAQNIARYAHGWHRGPAITFITRQRTLRG